MNMLIADRSERHSVQVALDCQVKVTQRYMETSDEIHSQFQRHSGRIVIANRMMLEPVVG